ncbi:MAG: BlaI/MecI/CopY family transcriptional regulator, partial [Gemmatimonadaceae bacterium]
MAPLKPTRRTRSEPKLQDTVRLSAEGLAKVLGDLEARILRAVWALGRPATARVIHERVVRTHAVSPLTTITVLNRLTAKRVLERTRTDDLYHYAARLDETAFMAHASRRVVEG